MEYFMDNYAALKSTAPTLVNSMTVPEFGVEALGAMAGIIGGAIVVQRYSPKISSGAKYFARHTKDLFKQISRKIT